MRTYRLCLDRKPFTVVIGETETVEHIQFDELFVEQYGSPAIIIETHMKAVHHSQLANDRE